MSQISSLQTTGDNMASPDPLHAMDTNAFATSAATDTVIVHGETPHADLNEDNYSHDIPYAAPSHVGPQHFDPEKSKIYELFEALKKEKEQWMDIEIELREEILDKSVEIQHLTEKNEKLGNMVLEYKEKYQEEVKMNKSHETELESDLEEEWKAKMDALIIEHEKVLMEEKKKYELLLEEKEIISNKLKKQTQQIKQHQKLHRQHLQKQKQLQPGSKFGGLMKNMFNNHVNTTSNVSTQHKLPVLTPYRSEVGVLTLKQLNYYDAKNKQKRLISIYGVIFDVTDDMDKFGYPHGPYCDFVGNDVTLCIIFDKWDKKWLNKFVRFNYKQIQIVKEYIKSYEREGYKKVGKLKNYQELQSNWPRLTEQDMRELTNDDCLIM